MMQPKERRERAKAALRGKILEAARFLFVRHGYDAVTMREIAARIGYTATALYYHFPDKSALLHELCDQDFRALQEHLQRLARIGDPVQRILKAGLAYVEFGLAHPQLYRFMFMTPRPEPSPEQMAIKQGDPNQDSYAFLVQAVREAIAADRLRPELRDAELVAQAFWSGMHGLVALHLNRVDSQWVNYLPAKKTAECLGESLLRGVLRRPDDWKANGRRESVANFD